MHRTSSTGVSEGVQNIGILEKSDFLRRLLKKRFLRGLKSETSSTGGGVNIKWNDPLTLIPIILY